MAHKEDVLSFASSSIDEKMRRCVEEKGCVGSAQVDQARNPQAEQLEQTKRAIRLMQLHSKWHTGRGN